MDIRFCDLCHESVPEADFSNGRASDLNGRVVCSQCEQAMGGGATLEHSKARARPTGAEVAASMRPGPTAPDLKERQAARPTRRFDRAALLVALSAVAVAGFGTPLLLARIEGVEGQLDASSRRLEEGRRRNRAERAAALRPVEVAVEEVAQRSAATVADLRAKLQDRMESLEVALERAEASALARGDRLRATAEGLSTAITQVREEMARIRERDKEVMELSRVLGFHGDLLVKLEEQLRVATVAADSAAAGSAGGGTGTVAFGSNGGPRPSWEKYIEDLASPDPGLRLDAVFALGQTKDLAVSQHVIPMLVDEDVFVRMVSAQVLGALRAKTAVPALIEALADARSAVREAAVVSLRTITGEQFNFEPAGRTQDRGRALEAWRSWWGRQGDAFLTS